MFKKYTIIMIFVLASIILAAEIPVRIYINSNDDVTEVDLILFTTGQSHPETVDLNSGLNDDIWINIGDNEVPNALSVEGVSNTGSPYYEYFYVNFTWATEPFDHWNNFHDHVYVYFDLPVNASVSVTTNSDVEEAEVVLYNFLDLEIGSATVKLDNNDYDSDGITEVLFENIYVEGDEYQSMRVEVTGVNVYGEQLSQSDEGFVWNPANWQWENDELELEYTLPTDEERTFHKGWNWVSTPRLFRTGNDGFDAEIVIDDLEPYALWIQAENMNDYMQFIFPLPGYWHHNNDFEDFVSTEGYKIKMNSDYSSYDINIYGTILPANTTMYLHGGGVENWIGYYPTVSQRPSVAFAQIWDDNLYQIKAEDWTMYKHGEWQGTNMRYTLNYGEMYIVKLLDDCPAFQWNYTGGVDPGTRDEAEHFTYEEEADYIPIFVDFEEGEEPLEIGVKVDGECKGAAKVEDSSVQINAYIFEGQGEEVEFEMFYGRSKPEITHKDYLVYNPVTDMKEKRKIKAGDYRDFYLVSFIEEEEEQTANHKLQVRHSPNPFHTSTAISYDMPEAKDILLEVYNIKGQRIKTLYRGNSTIGEHQIIWNGTDENDKQVSSGIYFYKLITPEKVISNKMLLIR